MELLRRLILPLIAIVFSFSCVRETGSISLVSKPLVSANTDSLLMGSPSGIEVADSLLFIKSNRSGKFIQVFSYPGCRYLFSIIEKGRGPGELVNLSMICVDNDNLYALGSETKQMLVFNIRDLENRVTEPRAIKRYDQITFPILSYAASVDTVIILNTGYPRVMVFDNDGLIKESPYGLPEEDSSDLEKIDPMYIPSLWNCQIDHDESNHILAVTTMLGDCLEIIDTRSFERKIVIGEGGYPALYTEGGRTSLGKIEGYYDVKIHDGQIYALFSGLSKKKLHEDMRNGVSTPLGGNLIKVFDLRGNLMKTYELDFYSNGFCIDKESHSLILLDPNDENPVRICDL